MLAIWIGNAITGVNSQRPPMVDEATLQDLITE
jgi:hypothetical protein